MNGVQPGAAPPKKTNWGLIIGLGCGGLVLVVGVIVAVVFFAVMKATAEPKAAVDGFLEAAAAGDYAEAHGYFSVPLAKVQPLDEFTARAEENAHLFAIEDTSFTTRSVDSTGAKFKGTVTLEAGTELPASFELVRENGEWKLLAYQLGS